MINYNITHNTNYIIYALSAINSVHRISVKHIDISRSG